MYKNNNRILRVLTQSVQYRFRVLIRREFGKNSVQRDKIERLAQDYPRGISWKRQNPSVNDFSLRKCAEREA